LSLGLTAGHGKLIAQRRDQLRRDLVEVIGSSRRIVWEVGSGHGHFLSAYAAAHPDDLCLGVDISSDRVARAKRKREKARLGNLHFILADADDFLGAMPERLLFSEIFVLFPDPWPKRRHHKNRVMKPEFLSAVAARAEKGACLYFRTDHEEYFQEAVALVRAHGDWAESAGAQLPFEEPTVFQKRAARHFTLVAKRA
jgi:tRNA (guanine-N7-)-methyltransferase